jgi:hypothetical protein
MKGCDRVVYHFTSIFIVVSSKLVVLTLTYWGGPAFSGWIREKKAKKQTMLRNFSFFYFYFFQK